MRKNDIELTFESFFYRRDTVFYILKTLFTDDTLIDKRTDKEIIFEAFTLRICAEWEVLVQQLLVDCFNKDTSRYSEYMDLKIPRNISVDVCRAILFGTKYFVF